MEDDVWLHYNFQIEYGFGYQLIVKQVLPLQDVYHLRLRLLPTKKKLNKIKLTKCYVKVKQLPGHKVSLTVLDHENQYFHQKRKIFFLIVLVHPHQCLVLLKF